MEKQKKKKKEKDKEEGNKGGQQMSQVSGHHGEGDVRSFKQVDRKDGEPIKAEPVAKKAHNSKVSNPEEREVDKLLEEDVVSCLLDAVDRAEQKKAGEAAEKRVENDQKASEESQKRINAAEEAKRQEDIVAVAAKRRAAAENLAEDAAKRGADKEEEAEKAAIPRKEADKGAANQRNEMDKADAKTDRERKKMDEKADSREYIKEPIKAEPVAGKAHNSKGSSPEEREVYKLLEEEVVSCLLDAVDRGDIKLQQIVDLAGVLHPTAGGNLKRKMEMSNFKYDRTTFREVLCDWYQYDWPENSDGDSGVTFEKLQKALSNIPMVLEKSSTDGKVSLKGVVHNEEKTKQCIGTAVWEKLLEAFAVCMFTVERAEKFAVQLNPYTGGWFKREKSLPNFDFSEPVFKKILMDWAARAEMRNKPVTLKKLKEALLKVDIELMKQGGWFSETNYKVIDLVEISNEEKLDAAIRRKIEEEEDAFTAASKRRIAEEEAALAARQRKEEEEDAFRAARKRADVEDAAIKAARSRVLAEKEAELAARKEENEAGARAESERKKAEVELTQVIRQRIEEEKTAAEAAKRRAVEEEKAEKAAKARREADEEAAFMAVMLEAMRARASSTREREKEEEAERASLRRRQMEEEAVRSLERMTEALTRAEEHMTKSKECVIM